MFWNVLTQTEQRLAADFQSAGLTTPTSTALAVLVTRRFSRPMDGLITYLRRFPSLEAENDARSSVEWFVQRGVLASPPESRNGRLELVPNWEALLGLASGGTVSPTIGPAYRHTLSVEGPLTAPIVFDNFLNALENSTQQILYWGFSTAPASAAAHLMQLRAAAGVEVRVLLASPDLAASLRGGSKRLLATDILQHWQEIDRRNPRISVRTYLRSGHTLFAGSSLIDAAYLRVDIYDPLREAGMEGMLLAAQSASGFELNLIRAYRREFDAIWRSARPLRRRQRVATAIISLYRIPWVVVPLLVAYLTQEGGRRGIVVDSPVDAVLFVGASAGIFSSLLWALSRIRFLRTRIPALEDIFARG